MTLSRRSLVASIICAPAIVRASSLMPVKVWADAEGELVDFPFSARNRGPFTIDYVSVSLAYAITRQAIDENLYKQQFSLPFNVKGLEYLGESV